MSVFMYKIYQNKKSTLEDPVNLYLYLEFMLIFTGSFGVFNVREQICL